ncbi:MAG: acylneuraminate cytidylyltransferase family protein [Patescibacteria group bacterium]
MIKGQKIVALVPLRGGSKSIPYKNIKKISGKPLAYWCLFAATNSKYIDEVWVSTDDSKIKKVVSGLGLDVKVLDRPEALATDKASTESVMLHFAEKVTFDILITVQATSPLTTSDNLDKAIEILLEGGHDSLVTVVKEKSFLWSPEGKALNYDPRNRPMRQDWPGTFSENGAFYITKKNILETEKCRLGGRVKVFEMPAETTLQIDEAEDWRKVAKLLKMRKNYLS